MGLCIFITTVLLAKIVISTFFATRNVIVSAEDTRKIKQEGGREVKQVSMLRVRKYTEM